MTATATYDRLIAKYPECQDKDICASIETLEFYLNRRAEGMSHNFAAMLATQRFPGTKTEAMYFEGRHTLADQFKGNEAQLEAVVAAARARGFNPSPYMVYEPGLADDIGDPKAFISPSGGTTQVRQVCEAHGKSCHGLVKLKGRQPDAPQAAAPLAPDIVNDLITTRCRENPELAGQLKREPKRLRELRESIRDQHGYTDAKRSGSFQPHTPTTEAAVAAVKPVTSSPRKTRHRRKAK